MKKPLRISESKFGGTPYPGDRDQWPTCPTCDVPLNFVLQLHKRRFTGMYFPRNKNLFQIFRCPNAYCDADDDAADRFMTSTFHQTRPGRRVPLKRPEFDPEEYFDYPENPIPEHSFRIHRVADYPSYYEGREEWWGKKWVRFQNKYTSDDPLATYDAWFYEDDFWSRIKNRVGIKIAGLPSWQQSGYPPHCTCGRKKKFIFQLASIYDFQRDADWQISIGDAGNVYHFVCPPCGEKSLQTCWDCG